MAHDILLGKIARDWSCGKSAAELWDEAESQRLHRPVHQMSPRHHKTSKLSSPIAPVPEPTTPWGWYLGLGAGVAGLALLIGSRH